MNKRIWLNNLQQENVIAIDKHNRHDIKKYQFKALEIEDVSVLKSQQKTESSDDSLPIHENTEAQHDEVAQQEVAAQVPPPQVISGIEAELIERLLERSDGLAKSLEAVQSQLDRQQEEMEKILREAKEESKAQGIKEGEEKAKAQLQEEIDRQLQAFADSITHLAETSLKVEKQIEDIEKDLSLIAIDIAKEVIAKEVSADSGSIALTLSKKLLETLKEATKILVKLNPQDYALLLKRFDSDERVKLQADKAIARGGVVVISDSGNLDGTIASRFENLKRSILEGGQ